MLTALTQVTEGPDFAVRAFRRHAIGGSATWFAGLTSRRSERRKLLLHSDQ